MDKRNRIIYELWKILDTVDTISDISKSNPSLYATLVQTTISERFKLLNEDELDILFDTFNYFNDNENEEV